MGEGSKTDSAFDGPAAKPGCAYILDIASEGPAARTTSGPAWCRAPCRPGSDYCPAHHALCHVRLGGAAETRRLSAMDAVADAVGGRQAPLVGGPPDAWLRRVEGVARPFFRRNRSRYVREDAMPSKDGMSSTDAMPAKANRKLAPQTPTDSGAESGPTPERRQHGPVERLERPIADLAGRPARPYRAVDTLAIMQRRGSITPGMRQAGEDFRARFAVAQLDPLRAIDLSHLRMGERGPRPEAAAPGLRIEAARRAVWRSIQAVGGVGSPAGSCLWHVLGWERSLKEWALEQGWSGRRVSQESAAGILIAALGALESHCGGARSLSPTHFSLDKSGLM